MVILPHAIMYAIMFFFTWAIFILAWSRRHTPGGIYLLSHLVALSIWVFGLYFEAVSTTLNVKIFWSQISYIGFTATVPFYLLFIIEYTSQLKVTKYLPFILFIVPFLTDIAAWTNQWHHLLWTGFYWGSTEYNILVYQHGVLFFLHLIFIYTLASVGLAILAFRIIKSQPPFRSQLIILLISGLFPIVSGSLYAFNIDPVKGMDTSSFGFLLTDIFLALGFAHYQLLDLVPVARDTLIKRIQDGMIVLDWKNRIVEINQNAMILLDLSQPNPVGRSYQEIIPWPIELEKLSRQNLPVEFSLNEAKQRYLELQVSSLTPQSSTPSGYLILLRDISTRKLTELQLKRANEDLHNQIDRINELQKMLQHEATHDSLTGLNNRRLSDEVLNGFLTIAKQRNQSFSILVMDIDHFKEINDQFGHQTGDNLLEEYGNAIRLATRKNDYSSRLGGDEILMAFQNMTIEEAEIKAGKLRQKLQAIAIEKDGNLISASVSIGIATYPLNGTSVNELISWADRALYAAKDKGRNQVVLASSVSRPAINKGE